MKSEISRPWKIKIHPYLHDHIVDGQAVMPAVETQISLAAAVRANFPLENFARQEQAAFLRFLPLPVNKEELETVVNYATTGDGEVTAVLLTEFKMKKTGVRRLLEHARVKFSTISATEDEQCSFLELRKLRGESINVPSASIYRELVPLGRSYQNIEGDLSVSSSGALAYVSGGRANAFDEILGSPFPLDATMHAACVWSQRFAGVIAFPVGFDRRIVYRKTRKLSTYLGRVIPMGRRNNTLLFDAWIFDLNGVLFETIRSMQMRDVSGGKRKPPLWIREGI